MAAAGAIGGPEHESLVEQVKALQRETDQSKTSWHDYCDALGGGIRDPKRHPVDFLMRFFEAHRAGTVPSAASALTSQPLPPPGSGDPKEVSELLVSKVKHGQRTSAAWKEAWWAYCDSQKDGVRDPARHDAASLRHFLEEIATQVGAGGGASASASSRGGGGAEPHERPSRRGGGGAREPEDRQRDRGGRGGRDGGGGGGGGGGAGEAALADRVKALQRKSEASKEHWAWYCDTFGGGVRDPARHPAHFLQQYLNTVEGGGRSGGPGGGAFGKAGGATAAAPGYHYHPYDQSFPSAPPGGPPTGPEVRPYGPAGMPPWGYPGYPPPPHGHHQVPGYPPPGPGYPPPVPGHPGYGAPPMPYGPSYGYPPMGYPGYGPPVPGYSYGVPPAYPHPHPYPGYKAEPAGDPGVRRY